MLDCIIIGSGPAGCSAAIYLGMSAKKTVLFTGYTPGGLLTKTHKVDNYLGMPGMSGTKMTEQFLEHARAYAEFIEDEVIRVIDKETHLEVYYRSSEKPLLTKYLIVSCGSNPKKLQITGEELQGVSYCAICDGFFYRNKVVAVVGGGNSAFEEVLYLSNIAKHVYLLHRSDQFRGFAANLERIKRLPNVTIMTHVEIKEARGEKDLLKHIVLYNNKTQQTESLSLDGLFIAIGYTAHMPFIDPNNTGVKKHEGYLSVANNYQTTNKRIFACGDCIYSETIVRRKQAVVSASEGCIASLEIVHQLDQEK